MVTDFMYVPTSRQPVTEIPHTDKHSCLRKVGFYTPTLATHSLEVTSNLTEDGDFYVTNEVTLEAEIRTYSAAWWIHILPNASLAFTLNVKISLIIKECSVLPFGHVVIVPASGLQERGRPLLADEARCESEDSPSLLRNKQMMQVSRLKALSRVVTTITQL